LEKAISFFLDTPVAVNKKARTFELSEKVLHIHLADPDFYKSSQFYSYIQI